MAARKGRPAPPQDAAQQSRARLRFTACGGDRRAQQSIFQPMMRTSCASTSTLLGERTGGRGDSRPTRSSHSARYCCRFARMRPTEPPIVTHAICRRSPRHDARGSCAAAFGGFQVRRPHVTAKRSRPTVIGVAEFTQVTCGTSVAPGAPASRTYRVSSRRPGAPERCCCRREPRS